MSNPENINEKLSPAAHYFKVDKKILAIIGTKDLSRAELLMYLLYCRSINRTRNLGCSFVGKNKAVKAFGLPINANERAMKGLQEKFFIRLRPDVKNGYYKSIPVEVLAFPEYTPPSGENSQGIFQPDSTNENQHRKYEPGLYINIPSALIDNGALKNIKRQEIFAIIALFNNINWLNAWGVDCDKIHKITSLKGDFIQGPRFGEGFHINIHGKHSVEAAIPDRWIISKDFIFLQGNLIDAINELIDKGIFQLVPVLVESFGEDEGEEQEIIILKQEIFRGLCCFQDMEDYKKRYIFTCPERDTQKIIWILRPAPNYIIKTPDYEQFAINNQEHFKKQAYLYGHYDIRTAKNKQLQLINTKFFWEWLKNEYPATYSKLVNIIEAYHGDFNAKKMFGKRKVFTDEFLETHILKHISIAQIVHYNNCLNNV